MGWKLVEKDNRRRGGSKCEERGKGEKSEEKDGGWESFIKASHQQRGTLNPETLGSRTSSISSDGSRPYPTSSIPLWIDWGEIPLIIK